jgi:dynein heavy chain
LEGIYIGNEDIRLQLPKATTTFEQHDKNFRKINDAAAVGPNIYANCVANDTTKTQLKNLSTSLDISQKKLKDYLESKKIDFPRFYFISDEDLLSILGSSDPLAIQPQLIKLFDNCKALKFENNGKVVKGMISDEGESYDFLEPFKPEGAVESWMNTVEAEMRSNLRRLTKEGVYYYGKKDRV